MALFGEALTRTVISAFYLVFNTLGPGFPENVYVGALEHECRKRGLHVGREVPIAVTYDDGRSEGYTLPVAGRCRSFPG